MKLLEAMGRARNEKTENIITLLAEAWRRDRQTRWRWDGLRERGTGRNNKCFHVTIAAEGLRCRNAGGFSPSARLPIMFFLRRRPPPPPTLSGGFPGGVGGPVLPLHNAFAADFSIDQFLLEQIPPPPQEEEDVAPVGPAASGHVWRGNIVLLHNHFLEPVSKAFAANRIEEGRENYKFACSKEEDAGGKGPQVDYYVVELISRTIICFHFSLFRQQAHDLGLNAMEEAVHILLLKAFDEFAEQRNLTYTLYGGTLIGVHRFFGFNFFMGKSYIFLICQKWHFDSLGRRSGPPRQLEPRRGHTLFFSPNGKNRQTSWLLRYLVCDFADISYRTTLTLSGTAATCSRCSPPLSPWLDTPSTSGPGHGWTCSSSARTTRQTSSAGTTRKFTRKKGENVSERSWEGFQAMWQESRSRETNDFVAPNQINAPFFVAVASKICICKIVICNSWHQRKTVDISKIRKTLFPLQPFRLPSHPPRGLPLPPPSRSLQHPLRPPVLLQGGRPQGVQAQHIQPQEGGVSQGGIQRRHRLQGAQGNFQLSLPVIRAKNVE